MTDAVQTADNRKTDSNRSRRLAAIRQLHKLLDLAEAEDFRGTVSVEVSAKDGRFSTPKQTLVSYSDQ